MIYLIDTNICIYILKEYPPSVLDKFLDVGVAHVGVSSITTGELFFGAENSHQNRRDENLKRIEEFLEPFEILDFDVVASKHYGDIRAYLKKKGQLIGLHDMQIAATALTHDLILVTNNEKEFIRVPGLKVENWAR